MFFKTPQQFNITGREAIHVEVDREFTVNVEFPSPRQQMPIVESGPCINSLGFSPISPTRVEYYMVGKHPGEQEIDFGSGCVAKVRVIKKPR